MLDRDIRVLIAELAQRIERLEAIVEALVRADNKEHESAAG